MNRILVVAVAMCLSPCVAHAKGFKISTKAAQGTATNVFKALKPEKTGGECNGHDTCTSCHGNDERKNSCPSDKGRTDKGTNDSKGKSDGKEPK